MKRRQFLGASAAVLPAMALGIPLLAQNEPGRIPQSLKDSLEKAFAEKTKTLKVFHLDYGGDQSYIIAESPEQVKHWWFTELGGEKVPQNAEVTEVDLDEIIRVGQEDLDDISEEDQKNYLHYSFVLKRNNVEIEGSTKQWPTPSTYTPYQFNNLCEPSHRFNFYIKKSAGLFLQETIDNKYPLPCCFCSTAG